MKGRKDDKLSKPCIVCISRSKQSKQVKPKSTWTIPKLPCHQLVAWLALLQLVPALCLPWGQKAAASQPRRQVKETRCLLACVLLMSPQQTKASFSNFSGSFCQRWQNLRKSIGLLLDSRKIPSILNKMDRRCCLNSLFMAFRYSDLLTTVELSNWTFRVGLTVKFQKCAHPVVTSSMKPHILVVFQRQDIWQWNACTSQPRRSAAHQWTDPGWSPICLPLSTFKVRTRSVWCKLGSSE